MKQANEKNVCMQCRECCVFADDEIYFGPVATNSEKKTLLKIGKKNSSFEEHGNLHKIKLVKHGGHNRCPFLDTKTWLCTVYDKRPFDCKLYPYIITWDKSKRNIVLCHQTEMCKAHQTKDSKEHDAYRDYVIQYLCTPEVVNMLRENPELIWDYDKDFDECYKFRILTKLIKSS